MVENKSYTCDRCGEVYIKETPAKVKILTQKELEKYKGYADDHNANIAVILFRYTLTGMDLCKQCNTELEIWLEHPKRVFSK